MLPIELLISLVLVGTGAGITSGLFGIGGGVVIVPFVLFLTQLSFKEAVAVSLVAIAVTVPIGLLQHHRAGHVQWSTGWALAGGGLLGVAAGEALNRVLADSLLQGLFAAVLVYAAHRMAYGAGPILHVGGALGVAVMGVLAGLVAKLLGIGGGILMVPWLVFAGIDMHAAVATSLVAVFMNGVASTAVNLFVLVDRDWLAYTIPVSLGAAVGTWIGSQTGLRSQAASLQRAFAILLSIVALNMAMNAAGG